MHINMEINLNVGDVITMWNNLRADHSFNYHVIYQPYVNKPNNTYISI